MSFHATHGTPPLELIEDAVHELRRLPLGAHLVFLLGTVPFLLGLLWFWSDMSRGAFADQRCAVGALAIAGLYLWMKTGHAIYGAILRERMALSDPQPWTGRRCWHCLVVQSALQPWGLLLVPLSLLPLMLPAPWVFAFFRHIDAVADAVGGNVAAAVRTASREAQRWPGQNHGVTGLFVVIGMVVILNVTIVLSQVPGLIKMLTGLDSDFTLSTAALVLNSTFLLAVLAVSYLVIMPLLIAVYARRSFEGAALLDGADLRAGLTRLRRFPVTLTVAVLLAGWGVDGPATRAVASTPASVKVEAAAGPAAPDLDQAIEKVLKRPDFSWRTRRELGGADAASESRGNRWERFIRGLVNGFDSVGAALKAPLNAIGRSVGTFLEWILGKRSAGPGPTLPGRDEVDWMSGLKLALYAVLVAASLGLVGYGIRIWRRRRPKQVAAAVSTPEEAPDLTAENVSAGALPEAGWRQMARELAGRGDFRLAIRALYLAALAHLADCELVRLADAKSNREYQRELDRRARGLPVVREAFAATILVFDGVWYGRHEATSETWAKVEAHFQQLRTVPLPSAGLRP